jgi:V/A-type H+-transporting ATPase subunit D
MATIRLTKNELKNQKDALKRFRRYLPTLLLKKQQLQLVLRQIEQKQNEVERERDQLKAAMDAWIGIFADPQDLPEFIEVKEMRTSTGNIAGIDIPVFENLEFEIADYDLFAIPLWVDQALETLKRILSLDAELDVLKEQYRLIAEELRVTSQRVNLFEKVKIPETRANIKKIQIYLGDQQTAAVVRGKMSKNKIAKGGPA